MMHIQYFQYIRIWGGADLDKHGGGGAQIWPWCGGSLHVLVGRKFEIIPHLSIYFGVVPKIKLPVHGQSNNE